VHAVGFAGKVEGIEPEAGDGLALVGVEFDFQAHPGAVVHADVTAAGGDELADLGFGKVRALDVDDDAEVEPVDVAGLLDVVCDAAGDGAVAEGGEVFVEVEGEVLGAAGEPFEEGLGPGFGGEAEGLGFVVDAAFEGFEGGGFSWECLRFGSFSSCPHFGLGPTGGGGS
jgi:hypothetical protein